MFNKWWGDSSQTKKKSGEVHLVWLGQNPSNVRKCEGEERMCVTQEAERDLFQKFVELDSV